MTRSTTRRQGAGTGARPQGREWPGLCERHFWILACTVVLLAGLVRLFDFSLTPLAYRGLFITRPFCGLHSWDKAHRAWAARNHVKYGLGYTKGHWTAAVGDPPPAHPQHYVSHPPLKCLAAACGMFLLGAEEWVFRLCELIVSVPALLLILFLLRKLYGSAGLLGDLGIQHG